MNPRGGPPILGPERVLPGRLSVSSNCFQPQLSLLRAGVKDIW